MTETCGSRRSVYMSKTSRCKLDIFHCTVKLPLFKLGSVTCDIFKEKSRDLALLELKR